MNSDNISALIEKGSRFEGNLSFSGVARISGTVLGSIYSNSTVIISEEAVVEADITADVIVVCGYVKGNLKASSLVEIKKPAKFEGAINTPSLIVEEGVVFHGFTEMKDRLI